MINSIAWKGRVMIYRGKVRVRMEALLKTLILPAVAVLLLAHIATAETQRDSDNNDEVTAERVSSIDFEIFADSIPAGMEKNDGATTGDSGIANLIERDTSVFVSGQSSLMISGSDSTTQWYSLSVDFPDDIRYLTVRFYVKGQNLQQEGNQFRSKITVLIIRISHSHSSVLSMKESSIQTGKPFR